MLKLELKTKPREEFFSEELDMGRMNEVLKKVISHLTLTEVLKMFREIAADMVCYYGEEDNQKGIVYREKYSEKNIWQATMIQRNIGSYADLFQQSIVDKREFDDSYFNGWDINHLRGKESRCNDLEKLVDKLRKETDY